jgi:hypothetical protein
MADCIELDHGLNVGGTTLITNNSSKVGGLVGLWTFDDKGALDHSGNGLHPINDPEFNVVSSPFGMTLEVIVSR